MQTADLLGWLATFLFISCYIPQIIKTYKEKRIEGLSFLLLFMSFVGNIIAFCYATLINQQPLQIKYILSLLMLGITIYLYVKVRMKLNGDRTS